MKFIHGSAWLCMQKLKKHSFETQKPKQISKIPKPGKSVLAYLIKSLKPTVWAKISDLLPYFWKYA